LLGTLLINIYRYSRCNKISNVTHTWLWRSQSEVSTDGGGDNNAQYSEANHDHDLLLRSALTDINRNLIQLGTKLFSFALTLSLSPSPSFLTLFPKFYYPHLSLSLSLSPFLSPLFKLNLDYSCARYLCPLLLLLLQSTITIVYLSIYHVVEHLKEIGSCSLSAWAKHDVTACVKNCALLGYNLHVRYYV